MEISVDPTVVLIQMAGFVLVLLVFRLFLFKPIRGILEARQQEIQNRYNDADRERAAAEQFRAEYEQHLKNVEEEMRTKIADAIKEGQAMREEIISDSREQAERILVKAQEEIQREKTAATQELKAAVADLTVAATEKLIEEKLDAKKHRELVSRYIEDLDKVAK